VLLHSDRAQWNRQGIYGVHRCSLVGLTIGLVQSLAFHLQFHLRILFEDLRVALTKHLLTLENRIVADFAAAPSRWYIWSQSLGGWALEVIAVENFSKSWRVVYATSGPFAWALKVTVGQ
jgi:hypothetical protein